MKHKEILKKYYELTKEGKLSKRKESLEGKLALILIFDQVPRFIFNDRRMYETDYIAKEIALELYKTKEYKKLS